MLATFAVLLLLHLIIMALARISPAEKKVQELQPVAQTTNEQEDKEVTAAIIATLSTCGISPEGGRIRIEKISG